MICCEPEDALFDNDSDSTGRAVLLRRLFALERFAVLATAPGEQPYTYLMAFAATPDLRHLVLVTRRDSRKFNQVIDNPHVALLVENCANDPTDTQEAMVVTALGPIVEAHGEDREQLLELYLARHPYLTEFASLSGTAVLRVDVTSYQIVVQFDKVASWSPAELAAADEDSGLPEGIITVAQIGGREWEFQFPRLTTGIYDQLDTAIELYWMGEDATAEAQYRTLIADYPEFIDARHHLALLLSYAGRSDEAYEIWYETVQLGLEHLPQRVRDGTDEIPWVMIENRPFLRTYHALGLEYRLRGAHSLAVKVWERLLTMNSDDNQGIRALAVEAYLTLGKNREALAITARYPDDILPETVYGRVLALYRLDQGAAAEAALAAAARLLPLVAQELTKKRHRKPRELREDRVTLGSPEEAYIYWQEQGELWKRTPGALDFVRTYLSAHPEIAKS